MAHTILANAVPPLVQQAISMRSPTLLTSCWPLLCISLCKTSYCSGLHLVAHTTPLCWPLLCISLCKISYCSGLHLVAHDTSLLAFAALPLMQEAFAMTEVEQKHAPPGYSLKLKGGSSTYNVYVHRWGVVSTSISACSLQAPECVHVGKVYRQTQHGSSSTYDV